MRISKRIKWILKNSHREKKMHIFAIPLSSRHKKRCRMLERLYCLFQCSKNQQCGDKVKLNLVDIQRGQNLTETTKSGLTKTIECHG